MVIKRVSLGCFILLWLFSCLFGGLLMVTTAAAEDLSPFTGRVVSEIRFRSMLNLNAEDLLSGLGLRVGDSLTVAGVQSAVSRLNAREIFENIDVEASDDLQGGVRISFLLTPRLNIGDVKFRASSTISERRLKRIASVRVGSPLDLDALSAAKRRLEKAYAERGYPKATIYVDLEERVIAPQIVLFFEIDDGKPTKLSEVNLTGEIPPDVEGRIKRVLDDTRGSVASNANIKQLRRELLRELRFEGYLQASIQQIAKKINADTGDTELELKLTARDPLTIIFNGNTVFTAVELLQPLKLETRTVPFSPNAISNLCNQIKENYTAQGYWFAKADFTTEMGADDRRIYQINIDEGPKVRLGSIEFVGNDRLDEDDLLKVLGTRPEGNILVRHWRPGFISLGQLATDLVNLEGLYAEHGYLIAEVRHAIEYDEKHSTLKLKFIIEEGELQQITSVEMNWEGFATGENSESQLSALVLQPALKAGEPFDITNIEQEKDRLNLALKEVGFPNARVDLEADEKLGTVIYHVKAGPDIRFGQVFVQGNIFSHDYVVQRELAFQSGELWTGSAVRKSIERLYTSGLFRSVAIEPLDGVLDSAVEDVAVRVAERDTGKLGFGVGFDTEDGLHLSGEIGQRNLRGDGDSLVLGIDGYFNTGGSVLDAGHARVAFSRPHLFDTQAVLLTEGFVLASRKLIDEFSSNRIGASAAVQYPISESLWGSLGVTAFQEKLFDVADDIVIGESDVGTTLYSMFQGNLRIDKRDDTFNPRHGFLSSLYAGVASSALGSEVNFAALNVQHSIYTELSDSLVWGNNARFQILEPFADTETIPLGERLFLGGIKSLRGFSRNAVGPRGEFGNIVGGDTALVFNTELNYEVVNNHIAVLFLDVGQAILEHEGTFTGDPLSFSDLRYSPGIGYRYKTPIGPISIDLGLNLSPQNGERQGKLNVGIGGSF